jgi:hypothetical protein
MSRAEVSEIRNVPASKVEQVVSDFEFEGLIDIQSIPQPDGMWTVRARPASNSSSLSPSKSLRVGKS